MKRNIIIFLCLMLFVNVAYADWAGQADKRWRAPVAVVGDLPAVGNQTGDVRLVQSPGSFYRWNGTTWVMITGAVGADHAGLTNLTYATAGHTGFEPTLTKGNLTETGSAILTITNGAGAVIGAGATIQVKVADASNNGYLTSTNWTTFNNKENALTISTGLARATNTITALLSTGVAGGQTAYGGTQASENLNLQSTTNGTRGYVISNDDFLIGRNSHSGKLILYAEEGVTDYQVSINPSASTSANADYYLPAALPGSTSFLRCSSAGILSFETDVNLSSTGTVYFGDASTNGSWKIVRSGNDLVIQRRESGSWVTKGSFAP